MHRICPRREELPGFAQAHEEGRPYPRPKGQGRECHHSRRGRRRRPEPAPAPGKEQMRPEPQRQMRLDHHEPERHPSAVLPLQRQQREEADQRAGQAAVLAHEKVERQDRQEADENRRESRARQAPQDEKEDRQRRSDEAQIGQPDRRQRQRRRHEVEGRRIGPGHRGQAVPQRLLHGVEDLEGIGLGDPTLPGQPPDQAEDVELRQGGRGAREILGLVLYRQADDPDRKDSDQHTDGRRLQAKDGAHSSSGLAHLLPLSALDRIPAPGRGAPRHGGGTGMAELWRCPGHLGARPP